MARSPADKKTKKPYISVRLLKTVGTTDELSNQLLLDIELLANLEPYLDI